MALTEHKDLLLDLGDGVILILKWDNEISNYRGYNDDLPVGIWHLETLLQIINGEIEDSYLEII
jgi:hypothetical protein